MASRTRKDWRKNTYDPFVARRPERKPHFRTSSGIEIEPVYAPDAPPDDATGKRVGFPGEFPYTRGVYPTMYRGRPWTIRQYAGFGTARDTNERFLSLLQRGQTGLSVAFDLPTQMGLDSDHPLAAGEVGRVGVAIDTVDDMATLFDGIALDAVSTSMTINATASILLAMYCVVSEERGAERSQLAGTVQNDILKEYIARGTYVFPPAPSMRIITDMFAWCAREMPNWNPISISGYHIREAGATAAQEIAFTLANGVAYVQAGVDAGLEVDDFAPRLSFFFNVHNNFFEEVAKFRAARRMWATLMRDRFGAKMADSLLLRFHSQTAGSTLTAQQPENNIVRTALQALAAVLGGTQSLHTNSLDEALGLPSDRAARIALRTQQVILEESGVADSIDPVGGSHYLEALTDALEERALALMAEIGKLGGMITAIEQGFPQREIERASYEYQKALERGDERVVGVNTANEGGVEDTPVFRVDPALEREQVARLEARRAARDGARVAKTLTALDAAARGKDNLMPLIMDAVAARATIGEICDTLAKTFGRHRDRGGMR
ncbi:MAG: methylmalonyl-CoA mutase family protein [Candidatus Krumholzibacteria bacterium]|nr:methylmalonyl-CoA mutase family protein [Candidatus Krumholzibacteria bacterium]MDH4336184.1 methylmalonyl-CoA mutase family protein [Candidatus Krumholzibacteria bacterium]MDH5268825.1 methylmalonyl-CoA mutase family protein [Candidatus Krumholzibacteria bacterium]